jgi:hypothetical protein
MKEPLTHENGAMNRVSKVGRIAFIGDYQPRKYGIATFASDLLTA